jgi:hypothetical protein
MLITLQQYLIGSWSVDSRTPSSGDNQALPAPKSLIGGQILVESGHSARPYRKKSSKCASSVLKLVSIKSLACAAWPSVVDGSGRDCKAVSGWEKFRRKLSSVGKAKLAEAAAFQELTELFARAAL